VSPAHHPEGQESKPVNANTALAEMRAALHLALSHLADASDAHMRALLAVNSTKDVIEPRNGSWPPRIA
jgi:hypothetical protein